MPASKNVVTYSRMVDRFISSSRFFSMGAVLDTRSGRCSLRKREQSQEALRCSFVPLDFQIAFAQRVGELPAAVDDSRERIGLPLDDRVGLIYASADQF